MALRERSGSARLVTAFMGVVSALTLGACAPRRSGPDAVAPHTAPRFAAGDSVHVDTVAPGIVHYAIRRPTGPLVMHVVTVVRSPRYEMVGARAKDSLRGRERLSEIVRRRRAQGERIPVALNADFFDLASGANENNQVIGGEIWKAVPVTDSPFDTFRNAHAQFAVDAAGRPYVDRFVYAGAVVGPCGRFALDGVNGIPRLPDALILFTGAFADEPLTDTAHAAPARLAYTGPPGRGGIGDVTLTRVPAGSATPTSLSADGYVLAAYGTTRSRLDSIAGCGPSLRVTHGFRPDRGRLTTIVGGWPRVVVDGRNVAAAADSVEGTFPRFSAQKHPRSAIGFSRDSAVIYLVAIDGRQETSDGMSLVELGEFLTSIGVHHGMNFDGGGSTTLVIDGRVVNRPSDAAGERAIGNAILVRETAAKTNGAGQ